MRRLFERISIIFHFYFMPCYWRDSWVKMINKNLWLLGSIWLIISLIQFFFKQSNPIPQTPDIFWIIFLISTLLAIISTIPPLSIVDNIQGKDITIRILIGDIFNQKGDIVVSTNSTFDTTFENGFISQYSIQGQLTKREYDKIEYLDQEISAQLDGIMPVNNHSRPGTKGKQYEIGTIAKLNHRSGFRSYWIAMADVNEFGKPKGLFENLQICLESLWRFIGEKGHMTRLIVPILGSGKTGINENRFTILKEIIFSFVAYAKEQKITEELVICIHPSDIKSEKLDIYELKKYLNYQCKYRYESRNTKMTSKGMG